jgi:hypothetical protein
LLLINNYPALKVLMNHFVRSVDCFDFSMRTINKIDVQPICASEMLFLSLIEMLGNYPE